MKVISAPGGALVGAILAPALALAQPAPALTAPSPDQLKAQNTICSLDLTRATADRMQLMQGLAAAEENLKKEQEKNKTLQAELDKLRAAPKAGPAAGAKPPMTPAPAAPPHVIPSHPPAH